MSLIWDDLFEHKVYQNILYGTKMDDLEDFIEQSDLNNNLIKTETYSD